MSAAKKWVDPFDDMSDADFDSHVDELFAARPSAVAVSFRVAPGLLGRVKREAALASGQAGLGAPRLSFRKASVRPQERSAASLL